MRTLSLKRALHHNAGQGPDWERRFLAREPSKRRSLPNRAAPRQFPDRVREASRIPTRIPGIVDRILFTQNHFCWQTLTIRIHRRYMA